MIGGVLHRCDHVAGRSGPNDSQRSQLVDTRIRGIQLRRDGIAKDIPSHNASQIILYTLAFNIHATYFDRFGMPSSSWRPQSFGAF
jgi:hypothetical protein